MMCHPMHELLSKFTVDLTTKAMNNAQNARLKALDNLEDIFFTDKTFNYRIPKNDKE